MSERRVGEQGVTPIRRAEGQLWLWRQIRFERFMAAWHDGARRQTGGRGVAA